MTIRNLYIQLLISMTVVLNGCSSADTVVTESPLPVPASPEKSEFLSKFDRLFNEDIAEQSDAYKDNIRQFILIHARDLLRQTGKDENAFNRIIVQRLAIQQGRGTPFGMGDYYSVTEEQVKSIPEARLLYRWSIGIEYDNPGMYAPFYSLLGVYRGKVVKCQIIFQCSACGGLFSDCCSQGRLPKYMTDDDDSTVKEVTRILDAIPEYLAVEINLQDSRTGTFYGFKSFHSFAGEKFSDVSSDFLVKAHEYFSSKQ